MDKDIRTIKTGKNIGVAEQIQGLSVEVTPHPKFKGMWQFQALEETWMASDYAFVESK